MAHDEIFVDRESRRDGSQGCFVKDAVDEAGVATGVGSGALSLCSEIGNSEETACRPRSEPLTEVGRGAAGTANMEAVRESLVHAFTGKIQLAPREAT